jgi:hypothetical protein
MRSSLRTVRNDERIYVNASIALCSSERSIPWPFALIRLAVNRCRGIWVRCPWPFPKPSRLTSTAVPDHVGVQRWRGRLKGFNVCFVKDVFAPFVQPDHDVQPSLAHDLPVLPGERPG